MGIFDGIRDTYYQWEDGYYKFLDGLDAKGIPVYGIVDPIDKVVPSFALFLALIVLVIVFLAWWIFQAFVVAKVPLVVRVLDNQESPLPGVAVQLGIGEQTLTGQTDAEGKTAAFAVPLGSEVTIMIDRPGFAHFEKTVMVSGEKTETVVLVPVGTEPGTGTGTQRRIRILDESGQLVTSPVTLSFSCVNPTVTVTPGSAVVSSGEYMITEPANCNGLIARVAAANYRTIDSQPIVNNPQAIYLSPIGTSSAEKGNLEVSVLENGQLVSGTISVVLYDSSGGIPITQADTSNGKAFFENLDAGTYTIRTVATPQFASVFQSNVIVQNNETTTVSLTVVKDVMGSIKIKVVRKGTQNAVENASVVLQADGVEIGRQVTSLDNNGYVTFFVNEDKPYTAVVDADNYCLATRSDLRLHPGNYIVELEPFTAACGGSLIVSVVDQDGKAVRNAMVGLANEEKAFIGTSQKLTDLNGEAKFDGIPAGTYTAFAFKGTISGWSDAAYFNKKKDAPKSVDLTVSMVIPDSTLRLKIVDKDGNPIEFPTVFFMDTFTSQVIGGGGMPANGQGILEWTTRADKKMFAVIEKNGFATFVTPEFSLVPNGIEEKTVVLEPAITKFSVELLGLFQGNLSAPVSSDASASLVNGQEYLARFLVKIPEENFRENGKKPSEIGLHVRTGDDTILERDLLFLKQTNVPRAGVVRSTSYTGDYATDSKAVTNDDAKWINAVWSNPMGSVMEADVVVKVKNSAAIGKKLNIQYRGWMKVSGTVTRDPVDRSGASNELYSDTRLASYLVGTGTLCDERFCFEASIHDPESDLTHALEDGSFGAKIKRDYVLTFSLANISKRSIDSFTNAELRFKNPEESIRLKNYTISDADPNGSKPISGNADAFELPRIAVGNWSPGRQFSGSIAFFTEKGKDGTFVLQVVDKDRSEVVFEREIRIQVDAEKQLAMEYEPGQLLAGIENKVTFTVTNAETNEPVQDAVVSIRDRFDTVLIGSMARTNSLGKVQVTLPGQSPGEELFAVAEKPDYNSAVVALAVDDSIATVEPQQLGFSLNPKTKLQDMKMITIKNQSSFPLIVHKLSIEGKFYGLVDEEAAGNALKGFEGREIAPGKDLEIPVSIMVSSNANQLTETANLNGQLNVELTNFGIVWPYSAGINAVIGLGGETDDSTCFSISRTEWKTNTEGKPVSVRFEIQNNCSVNGQPVPLQEIEAKVAWESNPAGNFTLVSSKSNSTLRSGYFKTIMPTLDAEGSETVDLTFTPSGSVDGEAKAVILLQATNPADSQPQVLKAELEATITIVNLLDCISISKEELGMTADLVFAQQTTGFGQLYNQELFDGSFEDTDYSSQMSALSQFGYGGMNSPFYNNGAYSGYNPGNFNYGTQYGFAPALGGTGLSGNSIPISTTTSSGTSGTSNTSSGTPLSGRQIMGATYPGLAAGSMAPPQDSFTITANGCGGPVTIELDSELKLSTKSVQLQADQTSAPIIVEGQDNFPGQYAVKLSIKGAGAKTTRQVFTLPVVIRSNPYDCIQMNKFEFNIFKEGENSGIDTARVFNYCFDKPVPVLIDKHSLDDAMKAGNKAAAMGLMMGLMSQVMNGNLLQKAQELKNEKESGGTTTSGACGVIPKDAKCQGNQIVNMKNGQLAMQPIFTIGSQAYYRKQDGTFQEVYFDNASKQYVEQRNTSTPSGTPTPPSPAGVAAPPTTPNAQTILGTNSLGQFHVTMQNPDDTADYFIYQYGNQFYAQTGESEVTPIYKQPDGSYSYAPSGKTQSTLVPSAPLTGFQFMYPLPFASGSQSIEKTGNTAIDKKREKDAEELASLQMLPVMMSAMGGGRDPFSMAFSMYSMGSLQAYQAQEDTRLLTVQPDVVLGQGFSGFGFLNVATAIVGTISGPFGEIGGIIGSAVSSQVYKRNAFSLLQIPAVLQTQKFEGVSVEEYRRPTLDPRRDNQVLSTETAFIKIQNDAGVVQQDRLNPIFAVLNVNGIRHKYDQDQAYKREIPTNLREKGTSEMNARFHLQFNSFKPDENAGQFSNELDNCTLGALRGSTGSQAVPRVKFSWNWNSIPMDACEESNSDYIYCDSTQFSISLLKKLELLREFTTKNAAVFECPELVTGQRAVEQTLSPIAKDIALTKLDWKRKGADINFLTTIESNNRQELSTVITTTIKPLQEDGTPGETVQTCSSTTKVLTSTTVGCVATGLPNNAYIVTSSFGTISGCTECENGENGNDLIFRNMTIGLDQTITQCEPFSTKRLKDFVEATERAGKTLAYPAGLNKEKTLALVDFESHLLKDGYSNDFRSDFHEFALSKSFFQTPKSYSQEDGLREYFSNPEKMVFDYYGSPNNPLPQPGVYKVVVDVNFADKTFSWFKAGEPNAKIIVSLEKTRDAKPASPFYNLPFDGAIGTDNGRNGYGLNYELLTADKPVQINRSNDQLVRINNIVGSNPAGLLKGSLEDAFATLNNSERGKVLTVDLSTQELKLAPSLATPVILKTTGTSARHAYAYYTLESNGQPQVNLDHLGEWNGLGATCKDFLGNDMASYSATPDNSGKNASCAIIGSNSDSAFGFEWCDKTKSGPVFLETLFYSAPESHSIVRIKAAANEAIFISPDGTSNQAGLSGNDSSYNSPSSSIETVQDVLDLVRDGMVCVSGFDNSQRTEFFWNPKPILESLQQERDNALNVCITG